MISIFENNGPNGNVITLNKNIPSIKMIEQDKTNVYDLLKYKNVLFTTSSIKNLQERLSK